MRPYKRRARIGQMTWYQSQNYGTVLQAFALQRKLRAFGADVQLINYNPAPWQQRNQSAFRKSRPFRAARMSQQRLMGVAPFCSVEKDAAFKAFTSLNILETGPVATSADFSGLNSLFDAFVCGSDQVWSPRCFDPRYYLDFVANNRLRVAYAPSFGCNELPEDVAAAVAPLIARFDALSVRESQGAHMVKRFSGKDCRTVCDPVVLLTAEEWRGISRAPFPQLAEDYCLCYFLGRSEDNWNRARSIAEEKGLKLVIVPVFNGDARRDGITLPNVGPLEFLSLINNSAYVCTDSFHGLVFSTIFERDFSIFERFKSGSAASQNVRIENYLRLTEQEERLLMWGVRDVDGACRRVDYIHTRKNINDIRLSSLNYLQYALDPVLNVN